MTGHEYEAEIGDYVDGTLSPDRVAALDAHLRTCAACRAMVADFTALRTAAGSLERKSPPPQVWARIAAGLAAETAVAPPRHRWSWVTPGLSWRPVAAAAVLVALLAGGTWVAWRDASTGRDGALAGSPGFDEGILAEPGDLQVRVLTQQIDALDPIVTAGAPVLPEDTHKVYQASGAVLDTVIGESRAVLTSEPSNEFAQESLFEALRSKLALLQDMVALINEMRKGNQEGAARIVSGMEQ